MHAVQVLSQRHMLSQSQAEGGVGSTELLPKHWITEQWNAGYFITALAGAVPCSVSAAAALLHPRLQPLRVRSRVQGLSTLGLLLPQNCWQEPALLAGVLQRAVQEECVVLVCS